MVTNLTNEAVVWAFNYLLIYLFFFKEKKYFVAGVFITINSILLSQVLESYISQLTILMGSLIGIVIILRYSLPSYITS